MKKHRFADNTDRQFMIQRNEHQTALQCQK
jgi:hypothetical protein